MFLQPGRQLLNEQDDEFIFFSKHSRKPHGSGSLFFIFLLSACATFVILIYVFDCRFTKFFQYVKVKVSQLFEINASFAHFVFSQFFKEFFILFTWSINIQRELSFSRRKTNYWSISLMSACIFIMVIAESNDGWPPHFGFKSRPFTH